MTSFPKDNSSAWCAGDFDCFGNRTCGSSKFTNYNICNCLAYDNPLTRCEDTFFDVFRLSAQIYAGLGILFYGIFFLLYLAEILTDLRLKQIRFPLFPKSALLVFNMLRLTHFSLWLYVSINGVFESLSIIDTILRTLGVTCLGSLGYLTVCIQWCDLLLKAKKLGSYSQRVRIIRIALIVACAVVTPITMTINIYTSVVNTTNGGLGSAGNAIGGVALILALCSTTYLLVVVYRWIASMAKQNLQSSRILQGRDKTRYLIAMNGMLLLTIAMIFTFGSLPTILPYIYLLVQIITRLVELGSQTCLYGFLQSYLWIDGKWPFFGYIYGIMGHSSMIELVSKTHHTHSETLATPKINGNTNNNSSGTTSSTVSVSHQ